jgi:hypothetical protein
MLASCVAQPLLAQPLTNSPVLPGSPAVPTKDASSPAQFTKSPVESFRELLVMPTTEQLKFLMVYPPEIRSRILEKIAEYQSLTPEIELRLHVTELRWYLLPLLSLPATNHAAQLALIPPAMRELVEPRLRQWTILPPPLRQMLLTNEQAVPFLIQVYNPTSQAPSLTEEQRRRLGENFRRMTELTPNEQDKVLRRLSDAEHRQMEKTLDAFEKLPPDRRARCIRSFAKFAALSAADQRDFLKNAARWSQMSFTERQAWRELVINAPILPPLPLPPPRRTPYPVGLRAAVTTNAQ